MSLSVAKMITSGMLGLNTSGLALYFGPQFLKESESSPVYENSEVDNQMFFEKRWSEFSEREKLIYDKLKEELLRFTEALKKLSQDKSKENSNILQNFSKTEKAEQELQKLYEENRKILEEMSKIAEKEHDASNKKLQAEEAFNKLDFYVTSLKSASSAMYEWGKSVKEFICAIDNQKTEECKKNSERWYSNSGSSNSSTTSQQVAAAGGGRWISSRRKWESSDETITRVQGGVRERIKKS